MFIACLAFGIHIDVVNTLNRLPGRPNCLMILVLVPLNAPRANFAYLLHLCLVLSGIDRSYFVLWMCSL